MADMGHVWDRTKSKRLQEADPAVLVQVATGEVSGLRDAWFETIQGMTGIDMY